MKNKLEKILCGAIGALGLFNLTMGVYNIPKAKNLKEGIIQKLKEKEQFNSEEVIVTSNGLTIFIGLTTSFGGSYGFVHYSRKKREY